MDHDSDKQVLEKGKESLMNESNDTPSLSKVLDPKMLENAKTKLTNAAQKAKTKLKNQDDKLTFAEKSAARVEEMANISGGKTKKHKKRKKRKTIKKRKRRNKT